MGYQHAHFGRHDFAHVRDLQAAFAQANGNSCKGGRQLTIIDRRVLDDEPLVKWFFEHGAQLYSSTQSFNPSASLVFNTQSCSYLDLAASTASIATFDLLVEHGAQRESCLPLHMAAGTASDDERIPMMAHLIDLGYNVNATDDMRGNHAIGTPLHYAIYVKSLVKVEFLLRKGANSHQPVGLAESAFKMAERLEMVQCVRLMKQTSELPEPGGR